MHAAEHGFSPEAERHATEILAIHAQAEILKRLPDDDARLRWVEMHAADFRKKFDEDASFRDLAKTGDFEALAATLHDGDEKSAP